MNQPFGRADYTSYEFLIIKRITFYDELVNQKEQQIKNSCCKNESNKGVLFDKCLH